ncbi:cnppd1 [Brachionus plicatilis]|uniref:Protein CNPPD1 n=1 Tax=Brachionus plicatilis TaxID=10195 RepID=A0A3M7QGM1_BRAPC|nr:cnppd1 [Brachionus plicatilis]
MISQFADKGIEALTLLKTASPQLDHIASLASSIESMAASLRSLDEKLTQLDMKVDKLDKKVDDLDKKVNDLDKKVNDLDKKVDNLDKKVNDLDYKVTQNDNKTAVRLSNMLVNSDKSLINWLKIPSKNLPHKCKDLASFKVLNEKQVKDFLEYYQIKEKHDSEHKTLANYLGINPGFKNQQEKEFNDAIKLYERENDDGFLSDYDYLVDDDRSKNFKLSSLSLPLTDTIAEYVQGLSKDKFFLNDLSFVFEMSRKRAISPYAIIVALLYLKRLKTKINASKYEKKSSYWPCYSAKNLIDSYFNSKNSEFENFGNTELCLVSILLASKFLIDEGEDDEIYNDQWADAADIPVEKINKLEKFFLNKMEWELFVSGAEFWKFTNELTEKATRKKVKLQLGNCTYSDLEALLSFSKQFSLASTLKSFTLLIKIFFVCSSTLLYVTLSTYFVAHGIIVAKNHLSSSSHILISMQKSWNQNSTIDLDNGNIFNDKNGSNVIEKSQEVKFENTVDHHQIKQIKFCRSQMNCSLESYNKIDDNLGAQSRKELFIFNQVFKQTFRLIF